MALTCYLDLDGVLADFHAGALAAHGLPPSRPITTWDFYKDLGLDEERFYAPMGRSFWASLPWTEPGVKLVFHLTHIFGRDIALVTSPVETEGCCEGKRDWVKKNLPRFKDRLFIGRDKSLLAGPDKVLVDDSDDNVKAFREAGGAAVLVPRRWNEGRGRVNADGWFDATEVAIEVAGEASKYLKRRRGGAT